MNHLFTSTTQQSFDGAPDAPISRGVTRPYRVRPVPDVPQLRLRDGVKPSYLVLPHDARYEQGLLVDFLCVRFPFVDRAAWCARLNSGSVFDARAGTLDEHAPYLSGQTIYYYREVSRAHEPRIPFDECILHVDEHLIVVDKPHFLPVIPSGRFLRETLLTRLRTAPQLQHLNVADITPIHRLDKDTAGVMLFSHNVSTRGAYQNLFQQRAVRKEYEAIAATCTDVHFPLSIGSRLVRGEQFFLTQTVAGVPNAFTTVELIESRGALSLYRLHPWTGKKHQLRVHMMALGLPLQNDGLYPVATPMDVVDFEKPLKLLARSIEFEDPLTGQLRTFESRAQLW